MKDLETRLLEEKADLQEVVEHTGEAESLNDSTGELSAYDNHPADIGTEAFERSRDTAIHDNLEGQLEEVEAALQRMKKGKYGLCAECGEPIPYERLEAVPYTAYCVEHASNRNPDRQRPVEEEVLEPMIHGRQEEDGVVENEIDDSSAWGTVEEYGSSDSPIIKNKQKEADELEGLTRE